MKHLNWKFYIGASLIAMSVIVYTLHYFIFHDAHHIFMYLLGDIGFAFIEVLLVTLIIHKVLEEREKKERMEKLNMVIGTFYSEVGTDLLKIISSTDTEIDSDQEKFQINEDSVLSDFNNISNLLKNHKGEISHEKVDWQELKLFLEDKKDFLLRLLENPNLLEHESFTGLLWAVFHLAEELSHRKSFDILPLKDYQHLEGDMKRVYIELIGQWLNYMKHLDEAYPYLFSLAIRTNPFDRKASPIVKY